MNIDTSKLNNVVKKPDGKIVSQCPACAAAGGDMTGNHLIVYPDGKFGCVTNPKDRDHNKEILSLVGIDQPRTVVPRNVTVRAFRAPPSKTVMIIPRMSLQELRLKRGDDVATEVKK